MILSQDIAKPAITLEDGYFDLPGLSAYSSLGISTIRGHIARGSLPCFKVKGKVLVRRSEFDQWIETFRVRKGQDLKAIADEAISRLKKAKSDH